MRATAPWLALLLGLVLAGAASAHVPEVFPRERVIDEADRSWAFYDRLPQGATHTWTWDLEEGETLFVVVAVPTSATWRPDARLVGPAGPVALERVDEIGLEPATPYAQRDVWEVRTQAPATGTYTLNITGEGGPYAIGFGLAEVFTPREWVSVPINVARIHAWEGRSAIAVAFPYLAGLAALGLPAALKGRASLLLPRMAAGLFLGTAIDRVMQLTFALLSGAKAEPWAWLFSLAFLVPSLVLAVVAWRARHPFTLAAAGVVGLFTWAGIIVGPILAFVAAIVRAWTRGTRPRPVQVR